ncbi:MAG TPA: class I SAM-dependent methyltransferase [Burkholderiales bacterium]|jgi:2-polyprenyl-3-methyl-5-hydroxy-6-metoxy-1,4-benzoquinol methylase|nr:class I SAM-dependent methyltransferase [Burkholderiales bacterium]
MSKQADGAQGQGGTHYKDARATWDKRYSGDEYLFGTAPNAFLAAQLPRLHAGQTALCVADGEGRNSVWLARQGLKVVAFDNSPVGVDKARKLAAAQGVTVSHEISDVAGWTWPKAAFDVVAAIFVQFADPQLRAFMFKAMLESLKPGGLLLVQGYTPKQLEYKTGGPPEVEHLYTEALLRQAFGACEIIELRVHESEISEGARHIGMSGLADLVARKPA